MRRTRRRVIPPATLDALLAMPPTYRALRAEHLAWHRQVRLTVKTCAVCRLSRRVTELERERARRRLARAG